MAPQFMATNGPPPRTLAEWMAWANSSLPVPDSPTSTTGRSLRAAMRASEVACTMRCDSPSTCSKL